MEVLDETYDTSDTFGYAYGFTKHSKPVTENVLKSMKGRFILRSDGNSKTRLTWSWTFDVTPLIHVATELLKKGAAPLESKSSVEDSFSARSCTRD